MEAVCSESIDLVLSKESTPTKDEGTTVDTTTIQFHFDTPPLSLMSKDNLLTIRGVPRTWGSCQSTIVPQQCGWCCGGAWKFKEWCALWCGGDRCGGNKNVSII